MKTSCPAEDRLRQFLDSQVTAEAKTALAAHLHGCPTCRAALDRLARARNSWATEANAQQGQPTTGNATLVQQGSAPSLPAFGSYQVQALLGEGGMGRVYRAFDPALHRVVAIKVLAASLAGNSQARQRFLREARAAAAVVHEHVVVIHAVAQEAETPYLVMQFVKGQSLQDRIDRGGPLPVLDILRIGVQTAEGLAAAHAQGLIHRDIKPANILLEDGTNRVKITDFGLARAVDDASLTQSGVVAGTPQFMSPEQANADHLDHLTDLFSLGSVMYAMCAGQAPFRAKSSMAVLVRVCQEEPQPLREVNPHVPAWLEKIIAKLMAKDPARRYQSAAEVADVLRQQLARLQQPSRQMPVPDEATLIQESPPPTRSNRGLPLLAGAGLLALVLLAAGGAWMLGLFSPSVQPTPSDPTPPKPADDRWVKLFNGKDLSGWKSPRGLEDAWTVENGHLIGRSATAHHLFSERAYADFHLRAEVRINHQGNSGIYFRCTPGLDRPGGKYPAGYEAQILNSHPSGALTGSLRIHPLDDKPSVDPIYKKTPLEAGEWFLLEVIAQGNNVTVKVKGVETTRTVDRTFARGHLALQAMKDREDAGTTIVHFRKIEIKELPPKPDESGEKPLFNGKDLTGWTTAPGQQNPWKVEEGNLVSRGVGNLFTEKDYENFYLRVEAMVSETCNSGVFFRSNVATGFPHTYEAQLNITGDKVKTGNLYVLGPTARAFSNRTMAPHKADQWFTLEVTCVGHRITMKVDNEETMSWTDPNRTYKKGRIGLQGPNGEYVKFREIIIKELPAAPAEAEWQTLFNGKDLTGWKAMGFDGWSVEKEVLVGKTTGQKYGWLMSDNTYEDFELSLEYKLLPGSNSGIFLRAAPDGPVSGGQFLEVQLLDDGHPNFSTIQPTGRTAAVQLLAAPTRPVKAPANEWHRMTIRAEGRKIVVYFGGEKVTEVNLDDHKDKFARNPGLAKTSGRIGLQLYPTQVEFKDIRIRPLKTGQ